MTPTPDSVDVLPRVIVPYDEGAFPVLEIARAAEGICEIIWLTGWSGDGPGREVRLMRRLGIHVDIADAGITEARARLAELSPRGIVVFCDAALEPAAAIAEALGLRFHSPETVRRLRDKSAQRVALAGAGLEVPESRVVSATSVRTIEDARRLAARWPAVLKPRAGTGSAETFLVEGPAQLVALLGETALPSDFILEDYLSDRPDAAGSPAASIFSVELLVDGDRAEPLALTGRFPFEPPFRESGSFLPSDVGDRDASDAVSAANAAARALGVVHGILHVEFKLTPAGPRIVEVNGRVGGLVPTLLERVGGPPVLGHAFRISLGLDVGELPAVSHDGPVAFYRAWLPPVGVHRVARAEGLPALLARDEVDQAWLSLHPGETVSSREGGGVVGYVAAAFGMAASHPALWALMPQLDATLTLDYAPSAG